MDLQLSSNQRRTVAAALTLISVTFILLFTATVIWLFAKFMGAFSNVLLPLAVAGILTLLLKPIFRWYGRWMRPIFATFCTFSTVLLPIGGFFAGFGIIFIEQGTNLIRSFPAIIERLKHLSESASPKIAALLEKYEVIERVQKTLEENTDYLATRVVESLSNFSEIASFLLNSVGTVIAWAVLPVYLFFFLMAEIDFRPKIENHLPFLKEETRKDVLYLLDEFVGILVAFFRGQFIVAFAQGILFALGFSLIGLEYGLLLGLALGFLNIIPYLGSIVGLGVALPLAYFQTDGGLVLFGLVILVFTIVQTVEGYVLTPRIMGEQTGLHPLAIIIAIFFWGTAAGGLVGMIFAIPFTAFFVVFWRLVKNKYIREII